MPSRSSPSPRSYLVRVPGVIEAGGVLRDTLGSLRNLDQLVRSMRVGPRGLERAIPDVHSACQPTLEAVRTLVGLLEPALSEPGALAQLGSFVRERLTEVEQALSSASGQPMTARHRLTLEQVLVRVLPELEAGKDLLELLAEAVWAPGLTSPLLEVLALNQVPAGIAAPTVRVFLEEEVSDFEIELPPSLVQGCLGILATASQQERERSPTLRVRTEGAHACVELADQAPAGPQLIWAVRQLVAPSLEVAAAALRTRGCEVQLDPIPRVIFPNGLLRPRALEA
jgi:hypothetical protein